MFSNQKMKKFTKSYLVEILEKCDAIVVGIGAGMSTSAGFSYFGERFEKYFLDFKNKYGINDMYSGGFYPFETLEEYWAWWSRQIFYNRYDVEIGEPYKNLFKLLKDKNYFIITTNVDHQIQRAGFDKNRLYYMQGDYGLWQCSKPCHNKTYDNEKAVREMIAKQENMKIPSELIPYCPKCGKPMAMNLRIDNRFVEDEGWHKAHENYLSFLNECKDKNVVFFELGVGNNTPAIIKFSFWNMTKEWENVRYICLNLNESYVPGDIVEKSICINEDIGKVLKELVGDL